MFLTKYVVESSEMDKEIIIGHEFNIAWRTIFIL